MKITGDKSNGPDGATSSGQPGPAASPTPPAGNWVSLLDVDYLHVKTADGGDLYLTRYGLPFWQSLVPENWYAAEWFEAKRERLKGTSTVYRVPTRPVQGRELSLVVKWSRVGEVVPLDTLTVQKFLHAEFNSPFEEFSLLMELRKGQAGPAAIKIRTQRPLAIYLPPERLHLWQTGRSEEKIRAKVSRNPDVEIDILRQYALIYGWVKGFDAEETAERFGLAGRSRTEFLARVTTLATFELWHKGYRVIDMKPAHIILRPRHDQRLLRDRNGQFAYALVDYELLERTPEHEHAVRSAHRELYLKHMPRRFEVDAGKPMPPHLHSTTIMGVEYVCGRAESTGGFLWVVGKDPELFNYFLPERWRRTRSKKLSSRNQVFLTRTKDDINLVWRVSRMGEHPWVGTPQTRQSIAEQYGYNSPFEEFAFALELSRSGVKTIYARAIYMTGTRRNLHQVADDRRYLAFADLVTPEGEPVIRKEYDYISIWGYWNGPDEMLAKEGGHGYSSMNARQACANKRISTEILDQLMTAKADKLARCGLEDLNFKPDHLLLSFDSKQRLVLDSVGKPEVRLCNFELVRRIEPRS